MAAVVGMRRSLAKQGNIGKTKSASSSTSVSSSEGATTNSDNSDGSNRNSQSVPGALCDQGEEDNVLMWIDPLPAKPPAYRSCNPNTRVRFPVFERLDNGLLPAYSPAVEEITVVSMKLEWISPYEPSPSRGWKNFIMEINSTQLNFYYIDPFLTRGIKNYCNGRGHFGGDGDLPMEFDSHHSIFSSLASKNTYQFNKYDQEWMSSKIKADKARFLSDDRLFRSYSLQFAKFGIPTDYNRKTFVLRLRCELEQFILSFAHVDDMILWSMYLSIGIGVSLDLDFREFPNYRTVPRRRRRRRRKRHNPLISRLDGNSRPTTPRRNTTEDVTVFGQSVAQRRLSSGLAKLSPKNTSSGNSLMSKSSPSSRRGSDSSIKSKLKSLFSSEKKNTMPICRHTHSRTKSIGALNSVTEDDEEEDPLASPSSVSALPKHADQPSRPVLEQRSKSMGPLSSQSKPKKNAEVSELSFQSSMVPDISISPCNESSTDGETTLSGELQSHPDCHHSLSLQHELEELQQVIQEHNDQGNEDDDVPEQEHGEESDEEEERDELVSNEIEDDDEDIDSVQRNEGTRASSIYQEEGIFHDSDDDYYYVVDRRADFRRRASSVTSNLSSTPYGSDEVKWNPPRKELSRRRYIRDSLRCIKPLPEDEEWLGKVAVRASPPPEFKTNNPPRSGFFNNSNGKSGSSRSRLSTRSSTESSLVLSKCKNHYLRPFIVGPVGLLKTNAR
ncbi:LAFE_0G12354g1_1 [Lachancea fermentati]|uniref:LAFE_0G12354g1_1 n=1 Tax=Lachancea fermentati TaxID=4955 RepID=A0A1G4MI51_LACFM|nr:LAFE_0G12354g1_1 [Lachancea fermentati]